MLSSNIRNDQSWMEKGTNMIPIPTDLIIEMFSRLPEKSVGRFRCLSKQWYSILSGPDFTELFRSLARPRIMFAIEKGSWSFFSSPQASSSSHVVAADFHSRFSVDFSRFNCSYASGLFYFRDLFLFPKERSAMSVVCNPITGRYVRLPDVYMYRKSRGFLGFEPVEKKFKVLAEGHPFCDQRDHHEVLTLGTGELGWRTKGMDTPHYDWAVCEGICINGVLYYLIVHLDDRRPSIVRFEFRSEEFKLLKAECFRVPYTTKLINYKGKLGGIEKAAGDTLGLTLCVLEDVDKQEWSKNVYTLPENKLLGDTSKVSVAGMTATGEIVLVMDYTCKPYYVFYFNPKKNTLQSVEIQGFEAIESSPGKVYAFVDHVEDLNVDESLLLESSIFENQAISSDFEVKELRRLEQDAASWKTENPTIQTLNYMLDNQEDLF